MKQFPLLTVESELYDRFGVEIPDEDVLISWCLSCLKKIGNANVILKVIKVHPVYDEVNKLWCIELPCNCHSVEAVTTCFESGREVSATDDFLAYKTYNVENWIESFKHNLSQYYLSGTFVKYTQVGDKLYFNEPHHALNILYKHELLDEEGLPLLSEKELDACVYYCLWTNDLKNARVQKDQASLSMAQLMWYPMLLKAISAARVQDMSQNQWNEVLNVLHSMDAHQYGVSSTKPIR